MDSANEYLAKIKRQLLTQRSFKDIKVSFMDLYSHLQTIYEVDS